MIDYPISEKLMQKNIYFLIKNLDFTLKQGRLIVYQILAEIIKAFPMEIIDFYSDLFFYSLVLKISNEEEKEMKNYLIKIFLDFLKRISEDKKRKFFLNHISIWINDSKQGVQNAAFEVLIIKDKILFIFKKS